MFTMAIVPREQVVVLFNSLMHGFNVEPILKTGVPAAEVVLGLISTFILGWTAGVLIAGIYNLCLRRADRLRAGSSPASSRCRECWPC